jgi:DNA-binding NtrC family response regulator
MTARRVLLLEDDLALRALLVEALTGEGFTVRSCDSFDCLRAAASQGEADIVVADFWGGSQRTLPDDERKEISDLCAVVRVVLLTGRSWANDVSATELGVRALIRKPFDLDHLLDSVETALADAYP